MRRLIIIYIFLLYCIFSSLSFASVSDFELKGTVFTPSLKPIAIIKDVKTGRVSMYEVGENIKQAKIIDIKRAEVILQEGKAKYVLALPGGGVKQPEGIDINIIESGAAFHITKADVNKAIVKAPQLIKQIRIVPYFDKGMPQGIRLSSIKQGSIFEKAGVKSGDVVKSINGITLNTPYQIFNAYKKLKDEKRFNVEILRDNKAVALNYVVE